MTPDADAAFNWHIVNALLAILSPLCIAGVFLWRQSNPDKIKLDQPLMVDFKKEFCSKEELRHHREEVIREQNKLEQRMTKLERKLETDKEEIIHAGEVRAINLHARINVAIEAVSELRGEVKGRFAA